MRLAISLAIALRVSAGLWAAEPTPANAPRDFVVHEWGTFSTFSGSDGRNLVFQPYDDDLPDFVHGYLPRNSKQGPAGGSISLETPVLYFYTEKPLTASVQVDFPKGILTEWYPQAKRSDRQLVWPGIQIMPGKDPKFPTEKRPSRYYAARETDAAPVQLELYRDGQMRTEQEKLLFYRGVGTFDMPLSVKARDERKFTVRWNGKESAGEMILVRVQDRKVRFRSFELERRDSYSEAEVAMPDNDSTVQALGDVLAKQLVGRGLYEKEARAMVKTWSNAWFEEEGVRVLYFLPDRLTDDLLPLKIEPKPTSLVRVLVGRHDVLTPAREKRIDTLFSIVRKHDGDRQPTAEEKSAGAELGKLGRYYGAAVQASEARIGPRR